MKRRVSNRLWQRWSETEVAELRRLRGLGYSPRRIGALLAERFGRKASAIAQKALMIDKPPAVARGGWRDLPAPADALAERERREAAKERLDLTGALMGDPPPGFSALDRRHAPEPPRAKVSGPTVRSIQRTRSRVGQ